MNKNDLIETAPQELQVQTPDEIVKLVFDTLVPTAIATYLALMQEADSEKVRLDAANKVMEIVRVSSPTGEGSMPLTIKFTGDQIQTVFGNLEGLGKAKIRKPEE